MNSPGRSLLTWLGRLFLLGVPFVLLCSLYYPKAIRFLDPVACPKGLTLSYQGNDPLTPYDNRSICESDTMIVRATGRIFAIAGCSFGLAVGAYTLRSRISPRSLSAPRTPQHA